MEKTSTGRTHQEELPQPEDAANSSDILAAHGTCSQRAMVAAKLAKRQRGGTQRAGDGRTIQDLANEFGVSEALVSAAKRFRRTTSSDLIQAVEDGKITLGAAERIVSTIPAERQTAVLQEVLRSGHTKGKRTLSRVLGSAITPKTKRETGKDAGRIHTPDTARPCDGMQLASLAVMRLGEIRADDLERQQAFGYVKGWLIDHGA